MYTMQGPTSNSDPAFRFAAVTPDDVTNISRGPARSLFVGVGGDIVVVGLDGAAITFKNVADGQVLSVVAARVNSTGTTATDIVALF